MFALLLPHTRIKVLLYGLLLQVKSLTDKVQFDNIQFISYCLATSMLVEVQVIYQLKLLLPWYIIFKSF